MKVTPHYSRTTWAHIGLTADDAVPVEAPTPQEVNTMLTIAILSLVLIPVILDWAMRRHRQTIELSMVRPGAARP
jgi:hypothetical protein